MGLEDRYEILELLGEGGFGYVHRAVDRKTGQNVAIKFMTKKGVDAADIDDYKKEVAIQAKLQHENIVQLYEYIDDEDFIYIVMELVSGGELFDELLERDKFTENDAAKVIKDVLKGVDYLHANGVAHRDLKPENLLLGGKSADIIKIADFGLSKDFEKSFMATHVGTHNYMAPEILLGERYTSKVDIFAIGVITYMLLAGYYPFEDDNPTKLTKLILDLKYDYPDRYWKGISQSARDFIDTCFTYEPDKRPTATEILKHRWIVDRTPADDKVLDNRDAMRKSALAGHGGGMKWKSLAKIEVEKQKAAPVVAKPPEPKAADKKPDEKKKEKKDDGKHHHKEAKDDGKHHHHKKEDPKKKEEPKKEEKKKK